MKVFAGLAVLLFLVGASVGAHYQTKAEPPVCPEAIPGVALNITFYPNEDDCSKYWECDNGVLLNGTCPDGLIWNPIVTSCDWEYNYKCPYGKPSLLPAQAIDCPQPSPGEQLNVTFFPNEEDCSQYWECDNGELVNQTCPDGLIWNPIIDTCDWPDSYDCPYDKKESQVVEFRCPRTRPGVVMYYTDENDIQKYWECLNGKAREHNCEFDMVYDSSLRKCVIEFS